MQNPFKANQTREPTQNKNPNQMRKPTRIVRSFFVGSNLRHTLKIFALTRRLSQVTTWTLNVVATFSHTSSTAIDIFEFKPCLDSPYNRRSYQDTNIM